MFMVFLSGLNFERNGGSLVVVVVDDDVEDDGVQEVDPVSRVSGRVSQVGEMDMEVIVTGLVVKVTPQLAGLQTVLAGHGRHGLLSDVGQQREMVSTQVSQGLQISLLDYGKAVQV